ncbi:MAG: AbrB/MazE/SpoVT family DNA-binding domain-containing protein [Caldilineaceae bacterium]
MSLTIQVAQRGQMTLPKELRDTYNIRTGDVFSIIDLGDGQFLLRRGKSQVDEICERINAELDASTISLEDMLTRLRTKREQSRATLPA